MNNKNKLKQIKERRPSKSEYCEQQMQKKGLKVPISENGVQEIDFELLIGIQFDLPRIDLV